MAFATATLLPAWSPARELADTRRRNAPAALTASPHPMLSSPSPSPSPSPVTAASPSHSAGLYADMAQRVKAADAATAAVQKVVRASARGGLSRREERLAFERLVKQLRSQAAESELIQFSADRQTKYRRAVECSALTLTLGSCALSSRCVCFFRTALRHV